MAIMANVLRRDQVTNVTLNDIQTKAREAYQGLWDAAKSMGRDVKLYMHWTGGRYSQFFDSYHIQIDYDGNIYVPDGVAFDDILSGTWKRNTGAISLTILGCYDMSPNSVGSEPPTKKQIEVLSQVICVLADALDLTIDIKRIMTHGEAADNLDGVWCHEDYGPLSTVERWDLEYFGFDESPVYDPRGYRGFRRGGDVIRGKANWYRHQGIPGVCAPVPMY